jgi:endonuclease/exonuclease/phosphatase family metal-dependent hydrolase
MQLPRARTFVRFLFFALIVPALIAALAPLASAQTTVRLSQPATQVTDTTIRGGTYCDTNFDGEVLATRASDNAEYVRRALLKFDTQNTIPEGTDVTSARLTFTVKMGGADGSRRIGVYVVTQAFQAPEATWDQRKSGIAWMSRGGDLGPQYAVVLVSNAAGSTVNVDLTDLVQSAVNGSMGSSRYTRVALVDLDAASRDSYREYYASEAADSSLRPSLTVTYGGSASTGASSTTTGARLRVVQWNTHHGGYGTDGVYSPDRIATWIARIRPDVVSLNEIERYTGWGNQDQPAVYASLLRQKTGQTWYYKFVSRTGGTSGQGNLILSRLPITSTGYKVLSYDRTVVEAKVSVNGQNVSVFSTHLDADSSSRRATQIAQMVSWASGVAEQRIIAGDFNAWPGASEISAMKSSYSDAWAEAAANGTAVAYSGNSAGNTRNSRIDYVFASRNATRLVLVSAQVFDTGSASDHRPVLAVYEVR